MTGCNPGAGDPAPVEDTGYNGITFAPITDPGDLKITEVFDNIGFAPRLTTGWGFSALVEYGDKTILFDTGAQGTVLLENMALLDISPQAIDVVVLSHEHTDHTGGLQALLDLGIRPLVYLPYGFPQSFKDNLSGLTQMVEVTEAVEIFHGVYSTGQMAGIPPEQGLIVSSKSGLVLITGCAHPGIDDMVRRTADVIDGELFLVMGGFHQLDSTDAFVDGLLSTFSELDVQRVMPVHCTGDAAANRFRTQYGTDFYQGGAGRIIEITD